MIRMTVSLTDDIGKLASQLATERNVSRSQLFAKLIEEERKRLLEKELAEGYAALADEHRRFAEMSVGIITEVWPPH